MIPMIYTCMAVLVGIFLSLIMALINVGSPMLHTALGAVIVVIFFMGLLTDFLTGNKEERVIAVIISIVIALDALAVVPSLVNTDLSHLHSMNISSPTHHSRAYSDGEKAGEREAERLYKEGLQAGLTRYQEGEMR